MLSVVEASLYPHDSSRVAKLLASAIIGSLSGTLYIGFTGNLHKHVFCRKFYQREFQRGRWRAVAGRDASTPQDRPTDDPPPLSMTEGKVS
jgi:hypothetical protein